MRSYLLDTNGLIYYYRGDFLGKAIEALVRDPENRFYVTNLTVLEMRSALASMVRRQDLTTGGYRVVVKRFSYDVSSLGKFRVQPLRRSYVDPCVRILEEYALRQGLALETLDCLHLLVAIDLMQREPELRLVTADRAFANVAGVAGVGVLLLEQ